MPDIEREARLIRAREALSENNSGMEQSDLFGDLRKSIVNRAPPFPLRNESESKIRLALSGIKGAIDRLRQRESSRVYVTAHFLKRTTVEPGLQLAQECLDSGDFVKFAVVFDFTAGQLLTLNALVVAADENSGVGIDPKTVSDVAEILRPPSNSLSSQVGLFLKATSQAKEYGAMLAEEPSGFDLIDKAVEDIERGNIRDYPQGLHFKDLLVAGAKRGRDNYKRIYPLTENL